VADGEPAALTDATPESGRSPTPNPAEPHPGAEPHAPVGRIAHKLMPHTFQGRLTLAFVAILALTLALVTMLVLNRLGNYFDQQQRQDLEARATGVAQFVALIAERASDPRPVISLAGVVDQAIVIDLTQTSQERFLADRLARADVVIRLGIRVNDAFVPASGGEFRADLEEKPQAGQVQERIKTEALYYHVPSALREYFVEVTLSNPYTYRATAIATTTGLLAIIGLVALAVSVVAAAALARRFTTPLRRLTEASRALAEGDLARRVPTDAASAGSLELTELALQFNTMADRVQESVDIIRRDRDRSRDFLADVSHELRTPIAAIRTFNELLQEHAGEDPDARAEFLEASAVQIERLDWLAQNLLELSKLDSGLVLLDLRPDDLRATVEQAVEQAGTAARRRGVHLAIQLPDRPLRIRHDPVRVGQVVANLVGNGIKFTPRGGWIRVDVAATPDGARIDVADTGVGIAPDELPRIFERFYRGTRASEARASGSGLGLAIVRSIVEMHGGSVAVESRLGSGSTFSVSLPLDPRTGDGARAVGPPKAGSHVEPREDAPAADAAFMADSSSSPAPTLNVDAPG
jgi:signal transduction histidine kinase